METYSEESLDKLFKKFIINIVLSLQTEMQSNIKILEEVRKLNEKFTNFNSLLQQRGIDLGRQCWANAQYSRRDWLEVPGITEPVKQNELEDKVLRIFKKVGCDTPSDKIEACHRVGRHNHVIIKFSKRKDCKKIGIKSFKISKVYETTTYFYFLTNPCIFYIAGRFG